MTTGKPYVLQNERAMRSAAALDDAYGEFGSRGETSVNFFFDFRGRAPYTSSVLTCTNFLSNFPSRSAPSNTAMPSTLVRTNASAPLWMLRSTCDSAAKLITYEGWYFENTRSICARSVMSPLM